MKINDESFSFLTTAHYKNLIGMRYVMCQTEGRQTGIAYSVLPCHHDETVQVIAKINVSVLAVVILSKDCVHSLRASICHWVILLILTFSADGTSL